MSYVSYKANVQFWCLFKYWCIGFGDKGFSDLVDFFGRSLEDARITSDKIEAEWTPLEVESTRSKYTYKKSKMLFVILIVKYFLDRRI